MSGETSYPPSGCARCGHRQRNHRQGRPRSRQEATGSHGYEAPTTEQIKERMLARRAARTATKGGTTMGDAALDHATARWHETNLAVGEASGNSNPPDPYRYAALLDARAGWWDHLGQLADRAADVSLGTVRDVYAIACSYAAELDRNDAAAARFRHRIPSLHPAADAMRIGLVGRTFDRKCWDCGRSWQTDRNGACETCPGLVYGITPRSLDEVAKYPPGKPWEPTERGWEGDGD